MFFGAMEAAAFDGECEFAEPLQEVLRAEMEKPI